MFCFCGASAYGQSEDHGAWSPLNITARAYCVLLSLHAHAACSHGTSCCPQSHTNVCARAHVCTCARTHTSSKKVCTCALRHIHTNKCLSDNKQSNARIHGSQIPQTLDVGVWLSHSPTICPSPSFKHTSSAFSFASAPSILPSPHLFSPLPLHCSGRPGPGPGTYLLLVTSTLQKVQNRLIHLPVKREGAPDQTSTPLDHKRVDKRNECSQSDLKTDFRVA